MRPTTLLKLRRNVLYSLKAGRCAWSTSIRCSSTDANPLQTSLHAELTARPANKILDYLSPVPWNLLNTTLADFLPDSCDPPHFSRSDQGLVPDVARRDSPPVPLPQGHHLVYFPPAISSSNLLPDGTDSLHSPGPPFVRRLWAGGSLVFNHKEKWQMKCTQARAICWEDISDVQVKGNEGQEKVFVTVRRNVGVIGSSRLGATAARRRKYIMMGVQKFDSQALEDVGRFALIEKRNLVFMREKSAEEVKEDLEKAGKVILPKDVPDFSVKLTPNATLLFRFSAMTFNAHRIHLDPQYAREVEGHRNLLVHGPLSLVLMLSVLRSQLREGEMIGRLDYRNLAPLYVDEEMKICVKRNEDKFDVWIEGREGGYAVKGTAVVDQVRYQKRKEKDGGKDEDLKIDPDMPSPSTQVE